MALNATKSTHLVVTRSKMPMPSTYSINGDPIPTKTNMKLLGVLISGDLKWNDHANYVCNRVNKVMGMLHRCMGACKPKIRRSLYISLIQPIIVFGAPAWYPISGLNVTMLEGVQSRATRFILGLKKFDPCDSRQSRLVSCRLLPIVDLFNRIDLSFLRNCSSGKYDFNIFSESRLSVKQRRQGLRGGATELSAVRGYSNSFLYSYFPRVTRLFNSLPQVEKDKIIVF
jgi:hypothetical protein